MSTDPNLDAMVETMKRADQLVDDMHDALAKANDLFDLHPVRIIDGLPVLDEPVAGHVHVVADASTTIVAVFHRRPTDHWWDPFIWGDFRAYGDYVTFGCGSLYRTDAGDDSMLRCHVRHGLLDSWTSVGSVLQGVLDREQYLELRDICTTPEDATTWGPWMTAIETGA